MMKRKVHENWKKRENIMNKGVEKEEKEEREKSDDDDRNDVEVLILLFSPLISSLSLVCLCMPVYFCLNSKFVYLCVHL